MVDKFFENQPPLEKILDPPLVERKANSTNKQQKCKCHVKVEDISFFCFLAFMTVNCLLNGVRSLFRQPRIPSRQ